MIDRHAALVEHYSVAENIDFIDGIRHIETEKTLHELFGIRSELTPDLICTGADGVVYVGEVKSGFGHWSMTKARVQAQRYGLALSRAGIDNVPFIIVDFYREILGK